MELMPPISVMRRAFSEKDASFDGTFFVAVKTTGIFCRPICRAKPARIQNVEFFPTAHAALRAGYRACKLCSPLEPNQPAPVLKQLIELSQQSQAPIRDRDLRAAGINPSTARRQFKAQFDTTFSAWQRTRRVGRGIKAIRNGANMTTAQITAGFESASAFREAIAKLTETSARRGNRTASGDTNTRGDCPAAQHLLYADCISSPLGPLLGITSDTGIVMLDFVDKGGFDSAAIRMKRKLGSVMIVPEKHRHLSRLREELARYFAGELREFTVPLIPHGTKFELKVWNYLRKIPYGETRTYGEQARAIGNPAASRAVGAANGRNDIGILIPCHRVIGASGKLVGYGGGLARKQWLLNHERQLAGNELF